MGLAAIERALDNCIYGDYKFLYLSPERLGTRLFQQKLAHLKVNLLAIDEAHCISQWGYDFRPAYLKVAEIREQLPGVPVLALTATATPQVVDDIQEQLLFAEKNVFQKSFERSNLAYVVRAAEDKEQQLLKILTGVKGSAVVYVRNRKKTREYSQLLQRHGISADYFHAGLAQKEKDVRQVVHMDAPDSLEAYFQEAGRAGRDEQKAYAVLLWSPNDKKQLNTKVTTSFPEKEVIRRVYDALGNFFQLAVGFGEEQVFDFDLGRFAAAFGFNVLTIVNSLKILQRAGYLDFTEMADLPSRVKMQMDDLELYRFQVANARLDPFLKVLLRSYTGLFTDYVVIDEEVLAKRLNVSRQVVYDAFLMLSRLQVLHYIPQRKTPLLTYLQVRLEPRFLKFPPEVYEDRLQQYRERADAVIDFASRDDVCRSRLLMRYFGQRKSHDCGHCDVCLARKKLGPDRKLEKAVEAAVRERLLAGPLLPEELVDQLPFEEDDCWQVLRRMEDEGRLVLDAAGRFLLEG